MQVTAISTGYTCTCDTFRRLAGVADQKCLHTAYIDAHRHSQHAHSPKAFARANTVLAIRPLTALAAQPYAYWIDDSFVFASPRSQQLRCSHDSHKSCCEHIKAVKDHLQDSSVNDNADAQLDQSVVEVNLLLRQGCLQVLSSTTVCCAHVLPCPSWHCAVMLACACNYTIARQPRAWHMRPFVQALKFEHDHDMDSPARQ